MPDFGEKSYIFKQIMWYKFLFSSATNLNTKPLFYENITELNPFEALNLKSTEK